VGELERREEKFEWSKCGVRGGEMDCEHIRLLGSSPLDSNMGESRESVVGKQVHRGLSILFVDYIYFGIYIFHSNPK